jgi:hypothetical protein
MMKELFRQVGRTVRFAIADECRTVHLAYLIWTTAIVLAGWHVLVR